MELPTFTLSGRLFTARMRTGTAHELTVPGVVLDPRRAPDGQHITYVAQGALRIVAAEGADDRALAAALSLVRTTHASSASTTQRRKGPKAASPI